MADSEPKTARVGTENTTSTPEYHDSIIDTPRPSGWMYKSFRVGKWHTPWYASPRFQLGLVAFVCFMCPGMFNALSGLGGGGKTTNGLADKMVRTSFFSPRKTSQSCAQWRAAWLPSR